MIFRLPFFDPRGVYDLLSLEAEARTASIPGLDHEERAFIKSAKLNELNRFIKKWIGESGSLVTVEFDTEKNTAVVVEL